MEGRPRGGQQDTCSWASFQECSVGGALAARSRTSSRGASPRDKTSAGSLEANAHANMQARHIFQGQMPPSYLWHPHPN